MDVIDNKILVEDIIKVLYDTPCNQRESDEKRVLRTNKYVRILRYRYFDNLNLNEIAELEDRSTERIRQIIAKSTRMLRRILESMDIREFADLTD